MENSELFSELINAAVDARQKAYCPYSEFRVGAAIVCADGSIFTGVNVENASYGLTVCAERVAITTAVASGQRHFKAIAICCDVIDEFKASCGACRQVLAEFSLEWEMYLVKPDRTWTKVVFKDLLPLAFTPAALQQQRDA